MGIYKSNRQKSGVSETAAAINIDRLNEVLFKFVNAGI